MFLNEVSKMITRKKLHNGFEYLEIVNSSGRASLALQGAHLFKYTCFADPEPLLWVSRASFFNADKAIRGGIPICWPWFGKHPTDPDLPQHGFARTAVWQLIDQDESDPQQTILLLRLTDSPETLKMWPFSFVLLLKISIGSRLALALITRNRGSKPFAVTAALHSYISISDIDKVAVKGLEQTPYFDNLSRTDRVQEGELTIDREVDRVFQKVSYPLTLVDEKRTIRVDARGSGSAVVWNPWQKKSAAMADMNDDSYRTMLCVETTNALADGRRIGPGEEHTLGAVLGSRMNSKA